MIRTVLGLVIIGWTIVATGPHAAASDGDAYIEGYATAVLAERFGRSPRGLGVGDGVITLAASDLDGMDRDAVIAALRTIRGVVRVNVVETAAPRGASAGAPAAPRLVDPPPRTFVTGGMPGGQLFWPLIADPRWPHFSASHQVYLGDPDFGSVAAVSFGETFTLHRWQVAPHWLEIGVQAGVFSIFDLDADSFDLINADYFVATVLGYRRQALSALARVFHQSSHLGDEFLLRRSRIDRVNLSYEGVDAKVSYELWGDALRPYAGAGYLVHREPSGLEPWSVQYGLEVRSPWPGIGARIRPIAAADIQHREENDWSADLSLRAGVQFGGTLQTRNMQLLLEYFNGRSFNGQFYRRKIDYLGVGVHFHF